MTAAAERWVRATIGWDLTDRRTQVPVPDERTWAAVERRMANERAAGLALRAIDAGAVAATAAQIAWLIARHEEGLVQVLRRDRLLLDLLGVLHGRGVHPVVLKGTVAAHLLYPDPALRIYGDIDLLVAAHDLGPSLATLEELGAIAHREIREAAIVGATTRGVAATMPDTTEIDLHTSIAPAAWSPRAALKRLPVDDRSLLLAGRSVTTLAPAAMALHAALHLLLDDGPRRMVPARDLVAALRWERTDPTEVVALGDALGLTDLLARGITRASSALPAADHPLRGWAQTHRASHTDRLWWWAAAHQGPVPLAIRRAQVAAGLDGWEQRLRYAADGLRLRR